MLQSMAAFSDKRIKGIDEEGGHEGKGADEFAPVAHEPEDARDSAALGPDLGVARGVILDEDDGVGFAQRIPFFLEDSFCEIAG